MQRIDLGTLNGTVIAYGGALGNLAALGAVLREAARAGVPAGRVISTGDIIGPCADSADCLAAVRAFGGPGVAGDHERALAAGASGPSPEAGRWWTRATAGVGAEARDWLDGLADVAVFAHEGRRYAVVHGGLTDPARALWPSSPTAAFHQEITAIEAAAGPVDAVIAGHVGVAFERVIDGVHWINAGAIGMPPDDGRQGGRYVRLTGQGARIERLSYDPVPAFSAMVRAGMTQGWDVALMTGRWPEPSGMPVEMCVARGRGAGQFRAGQ